VDAPKSDWFVKSLAQTPLTSIFAAVEAQNFLLYQISYVQFGKKRIKYLELVFSVLKANYERK